MFTFSNPRPTSKPFDNSSKQLYANPLVQNLHENN